MPPVNGSSPDSQASTAEVQSPESGQTQEATVSSSDVNAESSTAEGVKGPASALEAVKAALKAPTQPDEEGAQKVAESPTREADGKGSGNAEADGKPQESDLEDKSFSREANKRIRTLVAERNAVRTELDTLKAESGAYRERAEAYDTIVSRVQATGASAEQVDQAVALLGMINHNPAQAYEALRPIYQQLEAFVGGRLPDDLQEKVDGGYIDEASARELARLRNTSRFVQQRHQAVVQQSEQQTQERALHDVRTAVAKASDDWESKWRASDPDYKQKHPFVMSEIRAAIADRGGISSPQEAVEIAVAALEKVNASLSGMLPRRQEIRTVTGGHPSGNAAPKPRNALEAAKFALRGQAA